MATPTSALIAVHALAPRLVLLVGEALRPQAAVLSELAQDGLRCVWRTNAEQALRTAAMAHFDVVCLDSAVIGGPSAWALTRLREALRCPIAVIGHGVDTQEELRALEHGADLYLARPLPPRRLCAHLLALLRRPWALSAQASPPPPWAHAQALGTTDTTTASGSTGTCANAAGQRHLMARRLAA